MSIDSNFHLSAIWQKHVQSDGSNIAPNSPDPANYGFIQAPPGFSDGLLIFNEGSAYAAMELFTKRALQAGAGRLQLDFDLTDLGDFYANAQVNETDTRMVSGKRDFNFSLQRVAKTNMIQISGQNGSWVDTGFIAPPLLQGKPVHHTFVYGFDLATGHYGMQEITIGGVEFIVPYALQELTSTASTWGDGAYPQLQSCLGPNGGKVRLLYENMGYTWV